MAIRIRRVNGFTVALCAADTDAMPDDLYLDDGQHYALAAKFARDWRGQFVNWVYEEDDLVAETQKLRDAFSVHKLWELEHSG
jgi:hypothetical protein